MPGTLPDVPVVPGHNREEHERRIIAETNAIAEALKQYLDETYKRLVRPMTRWWTGTTLSLNTTAHTAQVQLDPFPASTEQPTVTADWGRPQWSAGQIVGKATRLYYDLLTQRWTIDDVMR